MGRSLKIATIRGIDVRVHITFPLIVLWAAVEWGAGDGFSPSDALYGIVLVLLLFACVVLHELGHSLTAMRFGVRVRDITLLPIGGVAQMRKMPDKPRQELAVAVAGPAVNVGIALVLGALIWAFSLSHPYVSPIRMLRLMLRPGVQGAFFYLFFANIGMALFNLIPAFPMDGGRILRAVLSMGVNPARATIIAARVGQTLSVGFLIAGVYFYNPMLMVAGVFIFYGAVGELRLANLQKILSGITAGQVVGESSAPTLDPNQALGTVTQLAVFNSEPNYPVVEDGKVIGVLAIPTLNQALKQHGPWAPVRDAMAVYSVNAQASDTLLDVQQLMADAESDTVQVCDDGGFRGILTRQHITQLYLRLTNQRPLLASK